MPPLPARSACHDRRRRRRGQPAPTGRLGLARPSYAAPVAVVWWRAVGAVRKPPALLHCCCHRGGWRTGAAWWGDHTVGQTPGRADPGRRTKRRRRPASGSARWRSLADPAADGARHDRQHSRKLGQTGAGDGTGTGNGPLNESRWCGQLASQQVTPDGEHEPAVAARPRTKCSTATRTTAAGPLRVSAQHLWAARSRRRTPGVEHRPQSTPPVRLTGTSNDNYLPVYWRAEPVETSVTWRHDSAVASSLTGAATSRLQGQRTSRRRSPVQQPGASPSLRPQGANLPTRLTIRPTRAVVDSAQITAEGSPYLQPRRSTLRHARLPYAETTGGTPATSCIDFLWQVGLLSSTQRDGRHAAGRASVPTDRLHAKRPGNDGRITNHDAHARPRPINVGWTYLTDAVATGRRSSIRPRP